MTDTAYPTIKLLPGQGRRAKTGAPWVFANELALDPATRALPPGAAVRLVDQGGAPMGVGSFNRHSLIAFRRFDRDGGRRLDVDFFQARLRAALALRQRFGIAEHCRLIHAEGDGMPGLIVDRYGDVLVLQANTAGMDLLTPVVIAAVRDVLSPRAIVLRNDASVRRLEGLESGIRLASGQLTDGAWAEEGGVRFPIDPLAGQKTGFFFDLRPARDLVTQLSSGARVLDLYCHTGAFGIRAASAGAASVLLADRSDLALSLAQRAAEANGVAARCRFEAGDAFDVLARLGAAGTQFDVVVTDPPSFVKSRKELKAGLRGYRKLARLAVPLVAPGGYWFVASCSHHVTTEDFAEEIAHGLAASGRDAQLIAAGGAGPDHPVHPHLPETAYIKWQVFRFSAL